MRNLKTLFQIATLTVAPYIAQAQPAAENITNQTTKSVESILENPFIKVLNQLKENNIEIVKYIQSVSPANSGLVVLKFTSKEQAEKAFSLALDNGISLNPVNGTPRTSQLKNLPEGSVVFEAIFDSALCELTCK